MSKKITIYTRPTCAPCATLKNYFKNKKIEFSEIDVDKDPTAYDKLIELGGYAIVPTTLIEDSENKEVVSGFNLRKILTAIG